MPIYSVYAFGVPSLARTIEDPKVKSKGRWATCPIPGYWVTTPDGKKIVNRRSVNLASWSQGVSNHSKKRELACCLAAYNTAPDSLIKAELAPATWHDPCRYNAVGVNAPKELRDVRGPVLDYFEESASIFTPMVQSMLGATEYNVTLSKNLHAAMIGTIDAVKALENTVKQWEEITERYGREKQIKSWLALKSFYPTTVLPW